MKFNLIVIFLLSLLGWSVSALSNCDPLDTSLCALPWPNDFWLRDGKVSLTPETLPLKKNGKKIDPEKGGWNRLDGWSVLSPIMTYFGEVDDSVFPPYWNVNSSLSDNAISYLIDASTGARLLHFVELDYSLTVNSTIKPKQMTMMWPAARLENSRTYIVAYRTGLKLKADGSLVSPSAAFKALRDNVITQDEDVESRRQHYNSVIFPLLESAGLARQDVLLAWSFTTGSEESLVGSMFSMREDAFARYQQNGGIKYKVESIQDNYSEHIARVITLNFESASYMSSTLPGSHLVRYNKHSVDVQNKTQMLIDNMPVFQQFYSVKMSILVPQILVKSPGQVKPSILQYGHGLFGSQKEAFGGYLQKQANQYGYIIIAVDWQGMGEADAPIIAAMFAADITEFRIIPDRLHQGVLNFLTSVRLFSQPKNSIIFDKDLFVINGVYVFDGVSSPSELGYFYHGNSQGGIIGTVNMALSTEIRRGVIGVTGAPYTVLLQRSRDFDELYNLIKPQYFYSPESALGVCLLFGLYQQLWDHLEPSSYMNLVTKRTEMNVAVSGPNGQPVVVKTVTPFHSVIIQHALGDQQVTQVGAYMKARSIPYTLMFASVKAGVIEPGQPELAQPIPTVPDDYEFVINEDKQSHGTSILMSFSFEGVSPIPQHNIPPTADPDTHGYPRKVPEAIEQMYLFFVEGVIRNTCPNRSCANLPIPK